ncbi:hypothetical protein [Flavobacterium soli]|uniref:hypothetical protein n=1 Tax=Flavobacterium soli TaxID=344881 RepID=UPI000426EC37|nr:hypothetical protein [Flavobacterium soli]
MTFKEKVVAHYKQQIQDKIDVFQDMITALTEDSKNDAKGSAGDKHETALSMMHIEQEKLNHKLQEFLENKAVFSKIDFNRNTDKVVLGSLVQANENYFLISVALPKISIEGKTVFGVSPQSLLAIKMLGNDLGFKFEINGSNYQIKQIVA